MEQPPPGSDADPEPLTPGEPEGLGPAPAEPPPAEEVPLDTSPALPDGPFVGGPAAPFGDAMQEDPAPSFEPPTMPEPEPPALAPVPDPAPPEPPATAGPGGWVPEDSPVFGGAAEPPAEASAPLAGDEMPPPEPFAAPDPPPEPFAAPTPFPEPSAAPEAVAPSPLTGLEAGDPLGAPPPAPLEFPAAPPAPQTTGVVPETEAVPRAIGSVPPPGYSPAAAAYGGGPVPPGAFLPPTAAPQPIGDYQLASWGSRALALLIDNILVMLAVMAAGAAAFGALLGLLFSLADGAGAGVAAGALIGGIFGYFVGLYLQPRWMATHNGQTIGKQVVGIRTIRVNGQPTELGWSALRQIAVIWFLFGIVGGSFLLPWLVNYLWPLWDEENRALHDMLVQSRVVKA